MPVIPKKTFRDLKQRSRVRRSAVAVWLVGGLAGCVSPPSRLDPGAEARVAQDPQALERIGNAAAAGQDDATAVAFYGRAVQLDPGSAAAVLSYEASLVRQGQIDEAVAALQAALPRVAEKDRPRITIALGRLLVLARRPTEAVAVFRSALNQTPQDVDLLVGLGVALDASRDGQAAEQAYDAALAVAPHSVAARNDLALSRALNGRFDEAVASLRALLAEVTENGGRTQDLATISGNLALVYAMQGNMHDAVQAGAAATPDAASLASNMRFYSVLGPEGVTDGGSGDMSGLRPAGGD